MHQCQAVVGNKKQLDTGDSAWSQSYPEVPSWNPDKWAVPGSLASVQTSLKARQMGPYQAEGNKSCFAWVAKCVLVNVMEDVMQSDLLLDKCKVVSGGFQWCLIDKEAIDNLDKNLYCYFMCYLNMYGILRGSQDHGIWATHTEWSTN